jgi:hypothetical protein
MMILSAVFYIAQKEAKKMYTYNQQHTANEQEEKDPH